ncbi:MAG: hypothetical protein ACREDO_00400 [Methyloceanibacter sp.]
MDWPPAGRSSALPRIRTLRIRRSLAHIRAARLLRGVALPHRIDNGVAVGEPDGVELVEGSGCSRS